MKIFDKIVNNQIAGKLIDIIFLEDNKRNCFAAVTGIGLAKYCFDAQIECISKSITQYEVTACEGFSRNFQLLNIILRLFGGAMLAIIIPSLMKHTSGKLLAVMLSYAHVVLLSCICFGSYSLLNAIFNELKIG